jgi:bifunctional NMN adenylyltransferase/nudix hydrolase
MKYDFLFMLGRFQPLHLGHQSIIDDALEKSHKVIILIGSANLPRSDKNPWTFEERKTMIVSSYPNHTDRLIILPLDDFNDDQSWVKHTQELVIKTALDYGNNHSNVYLDGINDMKIGIIGYEKDQSSFYLHLFPQFDNVLVTEQWGDVNATQIREAYFRQPQVITEQVLSVAVTSFLKNFKQPA